LYFRRFAASLARLPPLVWGGSGSRLPPLVWGGSGRPARRHRRDGGN